ncbi:MAG TPA: hypothetical protein VIR60_10220, partial [Gammaproteobacteria bacterium]
MTACSIRPIRMARAASRFAQRGAGMLLATVFLLVVVALFGLIALRMASTDATDSAVQNDSVEALFLAESGVERALQRLGAGITCASVAQIGTRHSLGRGDFEIQTSSVDAVTGWCNVRILGRVLLAGTSRAERLLDVALQQGGGIGAWAVGNGGGIYAWSGSSWSAVTSPTTARLNAVHCVSSTECWAVGNGGVIVHWTGGNWITRSSGTGEELRGVACIPGNPSACYAVGNDIVRRWNGSSWGGSVLLGGGLLTGVSCTSTTCYAVRDDQQIFRNLFNIWFVDDSFSGYRWNAIHCLPGGECWAAGNRSSNNFRFARLQAGNWNTLQYNAAPGKNLFGIHCTASDSCLAVGESNSGVQDTIIRRSAGSFTYLTPAGGENLRAIDCDTASDCLAVGDSGDVQRWNGSVWSQATAGMAN